MLEFGLVVEAVRYVRIDKKHCENGPTLNALTTDEVDSCGYFIIA